MLTPKERRSLTEVLKTLLLGVTVAIICTVVFDATEAETLDAAYWMSALWSSLLVYAMVFLSAILTFLVITWFGKLSK